MATNSVSKRASNGLLLYNTGVKKLLEAMPKSVLAALEEHVAERDKALEADRAAGKKLAYLNNQLVNLKKEDVIFRKIGSVELIRIFAHYLPRMDWRMKELDWLTLADCQQHWSGMVQSLRGEADNIDDHHQQAA